MIGMQRLTSLQHCVETALADDIPGDLIECGVWRGGYGILMRAVLAAYGDETRKVWLADSFQGVPRSDPENYQADKGTARSLRRAYSEFQRRRSERTSNVTGCWMIRSAFFLAGSKTPCKTPRSKSIAVLRLDGDLYESTIQSSLRAVPATISRRFLRR